VVKRCIWLISLLPFFAFQIAPAGAACRWSPELKEQVCSRTSDGPGEAYVDARAKSSGYAAVAVDGRGGWGASLGQPTSRTAGADAVNRCGGNCRVVMSGRGRCVAFADSSSNGYWYGHAYGENTGAVRRIAMQGCSAGGPAGTCRIKHVNCI
jgi:hypothetical protein